MITYSERKEFKDAFDTFRDCIKKLREFGIRDVRVSPDFNDYNFLHGTTYRQILGDKTLIDEDVKTWLKSTLGTLYPIDKIESEHNIVAMNINDIKCKGLGLSSERVMNTISVSFSHPAWTNHEYVISITALDEDATEETFDSKAKNICSDIQCLKHQDFLVRYNNSFIQTGNELWIKRNELFPNLEFCNTVRLQMRSLHNDTPELEQVINRLCELQDVASKCVSGKPMKKTDFVSKVSPESDTRLKSLVNRLIYLCPDGKNRLFSWHVRYTPGAGRIYFYPVESKKKFYIGYIGNKIV